MKKFIAAALVIVLAGSAQAQPTETLTLQRALELATQQQPNLARTRATIEAAQARVFLAKVAYIPTVTGSANATTGSSRGQPCAGDITRACGGFFELQETTSLALSANWRIYDFGQTRASVRAAELQARATETTLATTSLDIRRDVEVAYLEAVARGRLVKVAEATVASEDLHLDQARRFVAAQAKDPIEVAQAQARAANAKAALATAQSTLAIAMANLRSAIGLIDTRTIAVESSWPTPAAIPPNLPELVEISRKHRPELAQLDLQIQASEASVVAADAANRPVLSASASTQYNPGTGDWTPEPTWNAGLTLSWQFFDGGRSKYNARIARADAAATRADKNALLVSLTAQLDSARSQIIANSAAVAASEEAVTAARAQLQLAEARYAQGLGSQIELTDAQQAVTLAEGNLVTSQWQLATAWAQLRRALGEN